MLRRTYHGVNLSSANIEQIKELNELLTVTGVTTNPTIITKSGKEPEVVIKELIDLLDEDQLLFIQAVRTDYEGIMERMQKQFLNFVRKICM